MGFSINGVFDFSITGRGETYSYFVFQFNEFKVLKCEGFEPKVKFIFDQTVINEKVIDKTFFDKNNSFSKSLCGSFIFRVGEEFVIFDGDSSLKEQKNIYFSERFPKMLASLIADLIFRIYLSSFDIMLLHSAALAYKEKGILIPSWKGMGKTTLTIKLVELGYKYMADDRVWLSKLGDIYAYPRYIVLKDSNLKFFPVLFNFKVKIKLCIIKTSGLIFGLNLKPMRIAKKLISYLFKVKAQHYYIEKLIPDAQLTSRSKLDMVFTLHREDIQDAMIRKIPFENSVKYVDSVNKYEWGSTIMSIFSAHDALFTSSCKWASEHTQLLVQDEKILTQAFSAAASYEMTMPINPSEESFDNLVSGMRDICK